MDLNNVVQLVGTDWHDIKMVVLTELGRLANDYTVLRADVDALREECIRERNEDRIDRAVFKVKMTIIFASLGLIFSILMKIDLHGFFSPLIPGM